MNILLTKIIHFFALFIYNSKFVGCLIRNIQVFIDISQKNDERMESLMSSMDFAINSGKASQIVK